MSRRARGAARDPWRHLTPEVAEIVKANLREINNVMETPDGEKREPSEEGQGDQKGQRKNEAEEGS